MENETNEPLNYIKGVVESLLFVNERPVTLEQIKRVLETVTPKEIKQAIASLKEEFESRGAGITIEEIAGGYQMLSNPKYVSYVRKFYKTKHKEKLSKPALETLAIIAYKQPVTRGDIELIRGVNSDGVVAHLLNKELIKMAGRKDIPGRPFLYGTTKQFLEYFGLKSLDILPNLEELSILSSRDEEESEDEGVGVPESALAVNSLEKQKQRAIAEAERNAMPEESDSIDSAPATEAVADISEETESSLEPDAEGEPQVATATLTAQDEQPDERKEENESQ